MRYLTSGESHGDKLNIIIDDVPYGFALSEKDINYELKRRSLGFGRSARQDIEENTCKILSGLRNGKTTGNPISVEINNSGKDNYIEESNIDLDINQDYVPRPGHADLNGVMKYNMDSCIDVNERASGRETAARVVAGVVAKNFLAELEVEVYSYVWSIGSVAMEEKEDFLECNIPNQTEIAMSELLCPDLDLTQKMLKQIQRAKSVGDSLGGRARVVALGVVPGLGSYSQGYSRLDSKISAALMSVPSVKAIEFGSANYCCQNVGSSIMDQIMRNDNTGEIYRKTNYAGGIEGGITNGMPIIASVCIKPVPSVKKSLKSINLETMDELSYSTKIRSDVCVVPNVAIVCETEMAIVLANAYFKKFGCDNISDIKYALDAYYNRLKLFK